jgi:hypothetical protein
MTRMECITFVLMVRFNLIRIITFVLVSHFNHTHFLLVIVLSGVVIFLTYHSWTCWWKSPTAIAFSRIASFIGALGSVPVATAACSTVCRALLARCRLACPVRIICPRPACLMMTAAVCTGSGGTTLVYLCSSLLLSCPYVVPAYWTSFFHLIHSSLVVIERLT